MPGITLAQAQAALDNALAAHAAALTGGVEYRYNNRVLKTPPLVEIEASIDRWQRYVTQLSTGGSAGGFRVSGITPGD